MKECIYQRKRKDRKVKCSYTGTIRNKCPEKCKNFKPTFYGRLFGCNEYRTFVFR